MEKIPIVLLGFIDKIFGTFNEEKNRHSVLPIVPMQECISDFLKNCSYAIWINPEKFDPISSNYLLTQVINYPNVSAYFFVVNQMYLDIFIENAEELFAKSDFMILTNKSILYDERFMPRVISITKNKEKVSINLFGGISLTDSFIKLGY